MQKRELVEPVFEKKQMIPEEVLIAFLGQHGGASVETLGQGNINDSYLVYCSGTAIVLQRINEYVFPDPVIVAENVATVSAHIEEKLTGQEAACFPAAIKTKQGAVYFRDHQGGVWKAQRYLGESRVLERLENNDQAYQIGRCLGRFHALIADLDLGKLSLGLPFFHDLPEYLKKFDIALSSRNLLDDNQDVAFCTDYVIGNRTKATFFKDGLISGKLQRRVIHGDPKMTNVLFASQTDRALTLIDFDTVGPGLVLQDIADCLRSCSSLSGEDDYGAPVLCSADFAGCVLAGYLSEHTLTDFEKANLHLAFYLIAFELGLRFFTDYLLGNPYFRVTKSDDNLRRAVVQFKLAASIDDQKDELSRRFGAVFATVEEGKNA